MEGKKLHGREEDDETQSARKRVVESPHGSPIALPAPLCLEFSADVPFTPDTVRDAVARYRDSVIAKRWPTDPDHGNGALAAVFETAEEKRDVSFSWDARRLCKTVSRDAHSAVARMHVVVVAFDTWVEEVVGFLRPFGMSKAHHWVVEATNMFVPHWETYLGVKHDIASQSDVQTLSRSLFLAAIAPYLGITEDDEGTLIKWADK